MTSSVSAIRHCEKKSKIYSESDFSDENFTALYPRSKVLAEKEAWKIANQHNLNLTVLCPSLILGEYLLDNYTAS